jgi:DMSO/TMAO reductase YedYZ molybdopterin-dependent catalytic subunit
MIRGYALTRGAAVSAALLLLCAASGAARGAREPGATDLAPAEVRSYQGRNLSSARDMPDNSIKGPQRVDLKTYRLHVGGAVKTPLDLAYDDVLKRRVYRKVVTLHCVEGWDATILWEGVLVRDLLAAAGAGPAAGGSSVVIFTAVDGYTTSVPLEYVLKNDILLASRMNGVPVPEARGFPFVLVAEDKWGYKWIKWVARMEVSPDTEYRGYWEQRGYSNDGSLGSPSFP